MRHWLQAHLLTALLLLTACATDEGRRVPYSSVQVHLDTGTGAPRILAPPQMAPVEVTQAQFEATLARLVPELDLPSPSRQRLTLVSWGRPGQDDERAAMSCGYHGWCEHRGTPGDCLSLLGEGLSLGPEARRTLALTISLGSVWDGAKGVWVGMVDPVALQSMLMSAMAGYLAIWQSGKNSRLGSGRHRTTLDITPGSAWLYLASPPGCRKNATHHNRTKPALSVSHRRDGHLGWRSVTMTVRWLNYLWQELHPATLDEIELLARQWGIRFPEEYKKVISLHQGMVPEPCVFDVGRGTDVFNTLLTICEDEKWRVYSARSAYQALKPHVPSGIYPFGDTPGGQYVCFDYRTTHVEPKIVLVTVETDIHPIADSFSEFLAMLHD